MNAILFDVCWIIGGTLTGLVLHKGFHAGWWTLKKQSPAVRLHPELLAQMRSEIVFNAIKHGPASTDTTLTFKPRGPKGGQMRVGDSR